MSNNRIIQVATYNNTVQVNLAANYWVVGITTFLLVVISTWLLQMFITRGIDYAHDQLEKRKDKKLNEIKSLPNHSHNR